MDPLTLSIIKDLSKGLVAELIKYYATKSLFGVSLSFISGGIFNPVVTMLLGKIVSAMLTQTALGISWVVAHVQIAKDQADYLKASQGLSQAQSSGDAAAIKKAEDDKFAAFQKFVMIPGKGI